MSSAILYLAIVAIWACVLIPRWLRRDTARSAAAPAAIPAPLGAPVPAELDAEETTGGFEPDAGQDDVPPQAAEPPGPEETRRRMLAARRRLLLMLLGLEVAAVVLAVVGLAAVWVVIPPTLMLGGYLLLLREAGQADAERASSDAGLAVRTGERVRAQARPGAPAGETATGDTPAEGTPTEDVSATATALLARFAAAPVPADYEDAPGRDYAPGLAGKYTAATADADQADEDYHGGYQAPRLRAVGD